MHTIIINAYLGPSISTMCFHSVNSTHKDPAEDRVWGISHTKTTVMQLCGLLQFSYWKSCSFYACV